VNNEPITSKTEETRSVRAEIMDDILGGYFSTGLLEL
jgi:hypothetical protein